MFTTFEDPVSDTHCEWCILCRSFSRHGELDLDVYSLDLKNDVPSDACYREQMQKCELLAAFCSQVTSV